MPIAVASTGPATTGRPSASAVRLAQQLVAAAAPDEVDDVDVAPGEPRRVADRGGERRREAVEDRSARRAASSASGAPPPATTSAEIRAGMSPGGSSDGSLGSNVGPPAGRSAAAASRAGSEAGDAGPLPGPDRLLEQPQAHDVAQEADPSVDAQLVGEVGRAGSRSSRIGASSSRPTRPQVPQAMYAARSPAIGTPTTADAVSCDPTWDTRTPGASPVSAATGARNGPSGVPGSDTGRSSDAGSPSSATSAGVPGAARRVEQPGRRRVRRLRLVDARQPVADEVRDHRHRRGRGQPPRRRVGAQLVERVERQELGARARVQPIRRHGGLELGGQAVRPAVAVVERQPDEGAGRVQQAVVDAPRVDGDAGEVARRGAGPPQAVEDRAVQARPRPSAGRRAARPGRWGSDGPRRAPGRRPATRPHDHAPARRPEVDRGERAPAHRRNAAATPASTGMWRPVVWDRSPPVSANTAAATCSGRTSRLRIVRWA